MRRKHKGTTLLSLALIATWISACSAGSGNGMPSLSSPSQEPASSEDLPPSPRTQTGLTSVESKRIDALEADWYAPRKFSWHKPYREMKCPECHKISLGSRNSRGFATRMKLPPELLVPKETLCKKCHEVPPAPYVHAPVATQSCALCHEAHKSPWPHLLKVSKPRDLCLTCHVGDLFTTSSQHDAVSNQSCTTCHDPHSSQRPLFLKTGFETLSNWHRPDDARATPMSNLALQAEATRTGSTRPSSLVDAPH